MNMRTNFAGVVFMSTLGSLIKGIFPKNKIDLCVRQMIEYRKLKQISIIIQSAGGIDSRIKKYITRYGGKIRDEYPFINACNAIISPAGIKPLESLCQVKYISLDYPVAAHLNNLTFVIGAISAHRLNYTGKKINIALLDTGTYPHPDIIRPRNRILFFKDFVNNIDFAYDDSGHGTFTAGIILGNGTMSKNEYTGVAPEANLISLKVLNQSGNGRVSTVLSALQWVFDKRDTYGIKAVCLPLGCMSFLPWDIDPLSKAAQVLWESGTVVCTSAGNYGPQASWITSPGINPNIITVGALQTFSGTVSTEQPLCDFSGRGYTRDGNHGPDFLAPASNIASLNADTTFLPKSPAHYKGAKLESYYRLGSGTSAACAAITGTVALLLDKSPCLTPDEIKSLLKHSCKSVNLLKSHQGYGIPNISSILE
jgi:serine protease AprX